MVTTPGQTLGPGSIYSMIVGIGDAYTNARDRTLKQEQEARIREALGQAAAGVKAGNFAALTNAGAALLGAGDARSAASLLELAQNARKQELGASASADFNAALNGGTPTMPPVAGVPSAAAPAGGRIPTMAVAAGPIGTYARSIQNIESSGNPRAVGPVIKSGSYAGDQALGLHQIMGRNLPEWSRAALGREEFLSNPDLQNQVFNHRFGLLVEKNGNPQDAASAWFTGRPYKEAVAAGAGDQLGTKVQDYVAKFNRGLNGGGSRMTMEPVQTASAIDNAVVRGSAATPTMAGGDNLRAPAAPLPGLPPDRAALIQERRGQAAAVGLENANQGSTGARIPALTRALSNPNLPDAQRQLGLVYLKEAIDSTKAPDGVKEFLWARGQGLTQAKSPNEYAREKQKPDDAWEALTTPEQRAAAGIAAGDTHPVQRSLSTGKLEFGQPAPATAESEFERKVGGQRAEDYGEIVKRMRSAGGQLDTLKRMEAQMTDPKFYSGPFSGTAKAALRAAATVGLVLPDLADRNAAQPMEVFESLSNKLVTDAAPNGSLGAQISNTDREFMARIVPNLDASPAANAYLIQMRREILTREQEMAKQARAYVQKNRGFDEGFYEEWERWKQANPIERKLSPPPDALKAAPSAATAPAGLQPNERIIEWTPQTMGRF